MSPSKSIRHVWALDAPMVTLDKSVLLIGSGGEDVTIPTPSFLIEHAQGLLLFDSGLASDAAGDPHSAYGPLADMFDIDFPAEYRLDHQLDALGFRTTDVRRVVLSHAHFDHTWGVATLPGR